MAATFIVDKRSWLNGGIKRTTFINICVITLEIICSTYVDASVSLRSSRNKLICLDATIYRSLHYLRKAFSRINIMRFGWTWIYEVYSAMKFTGYVCPFDLIKQRLVFHFLFCLLLLFRSSPLAFYSSEYSDNLKWFYGILKLNFSRCISLLNEG